VIVLAGAQQRDLVKRENDEREERVKRLRAVFDGAIRYFPMLEQHHEWSDDECIAFARRWHAVAVKQHAALVNLPKPEDGDDPLNAWNHGIPYCRNDATKANLHLEC
jgi:hypothetical protein